MHRFMPDGMDTGHAQEKRATQGIEDSNNKRFRREEETREGSRPELRDRKRSSGEREDREVGPMGFRHLDGNEEFEPVEDGPGWVQRDAKRGKWLCAVDVERMGLFRGCEGEEMKGKAVKWLNEIEAHVNEILGEESVEEEVEEAWGDVKGGGSPLEKVKSAREEEVKFMTEKLDLWELRPISECLKVTGKAPVSVRWVDTNKGKDGQWDVRCRLVARDFKGGDKDRDDLYAETPPLEAKRMLFSRAATRPKGKKGKWRKLMFIDVRKAHLNPVCEEDVYIMLPGECQAPEGMCGKLKRWLYGFRPAAKAWEKHYTEKLATIGFVKGTGCGVVFYHKEKDISLAVHGDDFTFCGLEADLREVQGEMERWFDIKPRAVLGGDAGDDKSVSILGRTVRWTNTGIEYEADAKHRDMILEYFGFDDGKTRRLSVNGDDEDKPSEWGSEELDPDQGKIFRGLAARANFLCLDCPDLQFPVKQVTREMARPVNDSWTKIKKLARYLVGRERFVWEYAWQEEPDTGDLWTDSDWGGSPRDRRSTSGGLWMLGKHCIKTWSATQHAYALSSAEAELYGMVEGVTRAKGLVTLAKEIGFTGISNVVRLGTDSSAAKSFVCKQGLGKMRHLQIRDLWLQKEVTDGLLEVNKVPGESNPADLMTKVLKLREIHSRLDGMNIRAEWTEPVGTSAQEMNSRKARGKKGKRGELGVGSVIVLTEGQQECTFNGNCRPLGTRGELSSNQQRSTFNGNCRPLGTRGELRLYVCQDVREAGDPLIREIIAAGDEMYLPNASRGITGSGGQRIDGKMTGQRSYIMKTVRGEPWCDVVDDG